MAETSPTVPENSHILVNWEWNSRRYRAAADVANGELIDEDIAKRAHVTRRQLLKWKKQPQFVALVQGILGDVQKTAQDEVVTTKAGRLRILIDLHNKLLAIIEARAKRYAKEREWAAGEATGLIVTKESYGEMSTSREASVDTGLVKQIQSLHEQIAKELGQWETSISVRHSGRVDHVHRIPQGLNNLSNEELEALEAIALKAQAVEHEALT